MAGGNADGFRRRRARIKRREQTIAGIAECVADLEPVARASRLAAHERRIRREDPGPEQSTDRESVRAVEALFAAAAGKRRKRQAGRKTA